jgi:multidrug resistance efflux pump
VVLPLVILAAATVSHGLTRDQELSRLELKERHLLLAHRRAATDTLRRELETTRDLFAKGYVTRSSYNRTRNNHEEARLRLEEAEIQLEETKLALLKNATKISVREARKYRVDGRILVDLYL